METPQKSGPPAVYRILQHTTIYTSIVGAWNLLPVHVQLLLGLQLPRAQPPRAQLPPPVRVLSRIGKETDIVMTRTIMQGVPGMVGIAVNHMSAQIVGKIIAPIVNVLIPV